MQFYFWVRVLWNIEACKFRSPRGSLGKRGWKAVFLDVPWLVCILNEELSSHILVSCMFYEVLSKLLVWREETRSLKGVLLLQFASYHQ